MKSIINELQPKDYLLAIGPLLLVVIFSVVLYAIQVPINLVVLFGIGLIYWPLYEVLGVLLERGLVAAFLASQPESWNRFRNGFFPLLFVMIFIGLIFFKQWFWLVIFAQLIPLIFNPPDEQQAREGCMQSAVTGVLLCVIFFLAVFSVPEKLSAMFSFPNVSGELKYLPGMLILGIGYYLIMAVLVVLQQPVLRQEESST